MSDLSAMDSNNFDANAGVGEREARVASASVARRHFGLAHGVGRSGDITAEQPKAAGSSLMAKLTAHMATDALRAAGYKEVGHALVLPLATGMAVAQVLLALMRARPGARRVVWPRIDQKTCIKCVAMLGLQLDVVPLTLRGDELGTELAAVGAAIEGGEGGAENVLCVLTTASCFAPRACDDLAGVAKLCARLNVPHVVNNAYGIQAAGIAREVTSAWRKGRVDAVISSTDKNFMVPVGGSLIYAAKGHLGVVDAVGRAYPGRACAAPALDLFITLLEWGEQGWRGVLSARERMYGYAREKLAAAAAELGERLLETPGNPISLAMTLDSFDEDGGATSLGSMLFTRLVSGTRVVDRRKAQEVGGVTFSSFGAHSDEYPHTYVTVAAAVGTTEEDVDLFCERLLKSARDWRKRRAKDRARAEKAAAAAAAAVATEAVARNGDVTAEEAMGEK